MIEVKWERMKLTSGTPLERWHAHLVKPMVSQEFAWLVRRDGDWHLALMLGDMPIKEVATYLRPKQAMRHVERWIASRWQRTVPANGHMIRVGAKVARNQKG